MQATHTHSMDLEELISAEEGLRRKSYLNGDIVFFEGDTSTTVYQVRSGLVKLTHSTGQGRDVITRLCFPGEFIGLESGMGEGVCTLTATCVSAGELVLAPKASLVGALRKEPSLWLQLLERHHEQMLRMSDAMVAIAVERAEVRAARALLRLAQHLGKKELEGVLLPMPLSRQDFAELIGTTLETAIRVLSRFRKQGLVNESPGCFRFQPQALLEMIPA